MTNTFIRQEHDDKCVIPTKIVLSVKATALLERRGVNRRNTALSLSSTGFYKTTASRIYPSMLLEACAV